MQCGGETCPRPFFEFRLSLDQNPEVSYSLFYLLYVQVEDYCQNIETVGTDHLLLIYIKLF